MLILKEIIRKGKIAYRYIFLSNDNEIRMDLFILLLLFKQRTPATIEQ